MGNSFFTRFRQSRGRAVLFVALTIGAAGAAAIIVPAFARGGVNPHVTVLGQTQFVDNTPGDAYAVQGVVGGQNNATAVEGLVTNASATADNAIFGYTVAPSGNAIIGIAQPASGTATALVGYSYRGYGVIGQTPYTGAAVGGVLGQDLSGTGSFSNSGVLGTTTQGFGVTGTGSGSLGYGGNFTGAGPNAYGLFASSSQSHGAVISGVLDGVLSTSSRDSSSSGGYAGVSGVDSNSTTTSVNDSGVLGMSNFGTGITGQSGTSGGSVNAGNGVTGITNNNSSTTTHTVYGVKGVDTDPNILTFDAGVYGSSLNGYGLLGISSTYYGVQGSSTSSTGVYASSGSAYGLFATNSSTTVPALFVNDGATASASPLIIASSGSGHVFSLAADGSVIAKGTITASGTPLLLTHTTGGTNVVAYGARQSRPTIEDVGEGTLVSGSAFVAIDRSFGSTMDPNSSYLVFVTPQGDTNGLYVTGKSLRGFYVREHNGASNIAFDYRIVAKPAFDNSTRLPDVRSMPAIAQMLYGNSMGPRAKEGLAQIMARDRAMRMHLAASSISAAQLAAQRREAAMNATREAQLRKIKFPHVPTPAELHVPGTTHN